MNKLELSQELSGTLNESRKSGLRKFWSIPRPAEVRLTISSTISGKPIDVSRWDDQELSRS